MPYPFTEGQDAFPKPPEDMLRTGRAFSPLVRLAMRMGWVDNAYDQSKPYHISPSVEDVIAPFSYAAAHEDKTMDQIYVFVVLNGKAMMFTEPKTLFPTDAFIGRLKTLS